MPFGIGPLQFSKYFPEDPHNSYLNAFMSGGWLSGACYPALVAADAGVRLRARCSSHALAADHDRGLSPAIVGVATESFIIDTDHWRHTFLLLGLMWGLIAATRRHARAQRCRRDRRVEDGARLLHAQDGPSYTFSRRSVAQPG